MKKIILPLLAWFLTIPFCFCSPFPDVTYQNNRIANDGDRLWIVANRGLLRYDKSTQNATVVNDLFNVSETSRFISVFTDKESNIWAGTEQQVMKYDGRKSVEYSTLPYMNVPDYPLAMAFDADNNPYLGGGNKCIYNFTYDKEKEVYIPNNFTSIYAIWSSDLYYKDLAFDSKGNLWGVSDSPQILNGPFKGDYQFLNPCRLGLQCYGSRSLVIDRTDRVWITYNGGVFCYNHTDGSKTYYSSTTRQDVPAGVYTASDMDSEGNLWFSATDFLLKYDGTNFTRYACDGYAEARSLLCDGAVVWVYLDSDHLLRFENGSFMRTDLGASMGIDAPDATASDYSVTCDANGTLSVSGSQAMESVSLYTATGVLLSTTAASGAQSITLPMACPTNHSLYIVKISTVQQTQQTVKVVR